MTSRRTLVRIVLCGILLYALFPAFVNLWGLIIDTQDIYFIPETSSIFTFRPTVMNPGSGDWWIYGEDNHAYYYFENNRMMLKKAAQTCQDFLKDDQATWCLDKPLTK
jgi:hypothetical protein